MHTALQQLCTQFLADRDTVKEAFRSTYTSVYPCCANIFLSRGKTADADRLRECKKYVKENTGVLNSFRGTLLAPTCCLLATASDPEGKMALAAENYRILKEYFPSGDPTALAAVLLSDLAKPQTAREKAERGKTLYKKMQKQHPFLTGREDSVFAVLLAFSEKSDDAILDEVERCYTALKPLAGGDYIQTVSFLLAMSDKSVEEKFGKFRALFEALRAAGLKYDKDYSLSVLAALSTADVPTETIVADVADVDAFLHTQKGYKGIFGTDKRTRLMHAAMLTSTYYAPSTANNAAALSSMLAIIAMQTMLMIAVISASTSSSASSAASGR